MDNSTLRAVLLFGEHQVNIGTTDKQTVTMEAEVPIIKAVDFKPSELINENIAMASLTGKKREGTIHYFLPEYRLNPLFNKIWYGLTSEGVPLMFDKKDEFREKRIRQYREYEEKLKQFEAVCTPDFSVYSSFCNPTNLYDVWKNRLIGHMWQRHGLTVIPTVTWASPKTYEYAFLGLEPEGTYAISSNGCNSRNNDYREFMLDFYRDGIKEMRKRLNPKRVLVHGSKELPDADYGNMDVCFYKNRASEEANQRLKNIKKGEN